MSSGTRALRAPEPVWPAHPVFPAPGQLLGPNPRARGQQEWGVQDGQGLRVVPAAGSPREGPGQRQMGLALDFYRVTWV